MKGKIDSVTLTASPDDQWGSGHAELTEPFIKYDLALREWERYGLVSDREDSPFIYYHVDLNEWRLDRYLVTVEQLEIMTQGGWHLFERDASANSGQRDMGEIIGLRTESDLIDDGSFYVGPRTPGYWIVSSSGQIEIVPGAETRKPITVVGDET